MDKQNKEIFKNINEMIDSLESLKELLILKKIKQPKSYVAKRFKEVKEGKRLVVGEIKQCKK